MPQHHHVTMSPLHCVSQSFALPPATKPVSHLPCPLPPCHRITTPPRHRVTALVSHLPCPLPPNQSVICLAPYHRITASPCHHIIMPPHHCITTLVSHLPCPLPPNQSVICLAPCHQTTQSFVLPPTTVSLCHHVSQSFALPPATKPVSHLPCPLPLHHHVTASLH